MLRKLQLVLFCLQSVVGSIRFHRDRISIWSYVLCGFWDRHVNLSW